VLSQTYRNIEVFVIDDGSTDETFQIASEYQQRDSRVKALRQKNEGAAAARNLGISHARGEFIAPIDADDIWLPNNLQKQMARMLACDASVGVVYSWSFDIGADDLPLGSFHAYEIEGDVYTTLLCHNFLGNASATLVRASCLKEVGLYTRDFWHDGVQGCEDWELYLRIAAKFQFKVVPEFLIGYRKSPQSMSQSCDAMAASHAALLSCAERSAPVPKPARALSTSSFYIHLAHQCAHSGRGRESLTWLGRALRSEWLTPLLRIEVYLLCARVVLAGCNVTTLPRTKIEAVTLLSLQRNRSLYRRLFLGSMLHRTLTFAFEDKRKRTIGNYKLESVPSAVP